MPELPEVETIRIGLQKYLVGHRILETDVKLPRIFAGETKNIIGGKFKSVERYGKGLVLNLDNGFSIAIHIKLTGQLIYNDVAFVKNRNIHISKSKVGTLPNKFTHVIFKLDPSAGSGQAAFLFYNDVRRFGWIKIVKTTNLKTLPFFKDLGPEPPVAKAMGGQALLEPKKFEEILSKSSSPVKIILMDQKRIGGVGNIYANDALWLSGIDPRRSAKQITKEEAKKLYEAILTVLKSGLKYGGASELTFVNALGEEGGYQNHFLVYGKDGKPCSKDGTIIKKIFLGGRGTYFCPKHQK